MLEAAKQTPSQPAPASLLRPSWRPETHHHDQIQAGADCLVSAATEQKARSLPSIISMISHAVRIFNPAPDNQRQRYFMPLGTCKHT